MHKTIEIISPCYNPEPLWAEAYILRTTEFTNLLPPDLTLQWTIVDDGSRTDINTGMQLLQSHMPTINILKYPTNRGKGYAIRHAVSQSRADIIVYTDIDLPFTSESMYGVIYPVLEGTTDASLGLRSAQYYQSIPVFRKIVSQSLLVLNKFVLRLKHTDTQCGLKAFNKSIAPYLLMTSLDGFLFEIQFIKILESHPHLRVSPVKVSLRTQISLSDIGIKSIVKHIKVFMKIFLKRS